MTRVKTFVLLLAVVGLCVGSALGQAPKTTIFEVAYGLGPTNHDDFAGRDNSIIGEPGLDHCNHGSKAQVRVLKAWAHTYLADWDTAPMMADVDVGGQLTGWGAYTPNYYMAIRPVGGQTPPALPDFPDPATPGIVNISSVWSTDDWYEGEANGYWIQYNWIWPPIPEWASTIWNAGDHVIGGMEIPWGFPGGGTGANAPYPYFWDCTFIETFHTMGDYHDFAEDGNHGPGWAPWNGEPKTPTNSTPFSLSLDNFYLDDNGTPADPNDDFYVGMYAEVPLDQALIDDMLQNVNNRGFALWEWDVWENGPIYSADTNSAHWPYIYARIEVCDGDATLDKNVDGLDYMAWSNNYLQAAIWQTGDFNNDAIADGLDYVVWSNNYLQGCPGQVPEPTGLLLLTIGACLPLRRRRR